MCFYLGEYREPLTTEQDFYCWKVVVAPPKSKRFTTSLYSGFKYLFNTEYKTEMKLTKTDFFDVITKKAKEDHYNIFQGFHSYDSFIRAEEEYCEAVNEADCVIVECIIPKGALFYHNQDNKQYVSNKIIIKKVCDSEGN